MSNSQNQSLPPTDPNPTELRSIIHPTESLNPPLRSLRRSYELLSISYFVSIFGPAIGFPDFSVRKLEADLDGTSPDSYVPTLAIRLLIVLTGDRCINAGNWESRLRREYMRRDPLENPLGAEPLKPKLRYPKKAVGYVYISEYIVDLPKPLPDPVTHPIIHSTQPSSNSQPTLTNGASPDDSIQHTKAEPVDCQTEPSGASTAEDLTTKTNVTDDITSTPLSPVPQVLGHDSLMSARPEKTETDLNPNTDSPVQSTSSLPGPLPILDTSSRQCDSTITSPLDQNQKPDEPINTQAHPDTDPTSTAEVSSILETKLPTPVEAHGSSTPNQIDDQVTEQVPVVIPWSELSPITKLRALFKLCEWNFESAHDTERFRRMIEGRAVGFTGMNTASGALNGGSESGEWRQERCGVDGKGHSYWFTGQGIEATLWVQRQEPRPIKKNIITLRLASSSKSNGRGKRSKVQVSKSKSNPRKRTLDNPDDTPGSSSQADTGPSRRTSISNQTPKSKRPRLSGTRTSSRLRKGSTQEEWQEVPPDWYDAEPTPKVISTPVPTKPARSSGRLRKESLVQNDSLDSAPTGSSRVEASSQVQRPPTMIVIKNSAFTAGLKPKKLERIVSGTRASPRGRSGDAEEWQDVPQGWLDEVVISSGSGPSHDVPANSALSSELTEDLSSEGDDRQFNQSRLSPTEPIDQVVSPDKMVTVNQTEEPIILSQVDTDCKRSTIYIPSGLNEGQQIPGPDLSSSIPIEVASDMKLDDAPDPPEASELPTVTKNDSQDPLDSNILPVQADPDVEMKDGTVKEQTDVLSQTDVVENRDVIPLPTDLGTHHDEPSEVTQPVDSDKVDERMELDDEIRQDQPSLRPVTVDNAEVVQQSTLSTSLENGNKPSIDQSIPDPIKSSLDITLCESPIDDKSPPSLNLIGKKGNENIGSELDTVKMETSLEPNHVQTDVKVDEPYLKFDHPELKGHPLDPEWIGWEMVCSNLSEWQQFSRQFEGTTDTDEIALINFVNEGVLPMLVEAYQEHAKRLKMEQSIAQRKRSSRIATREVIQTSAAEAAAAVIPERENRVLHSERLEAKRLKEIQAEEDQKQEEVDQRLIRLREREERIALREAQLVIEREAEKKREERARLRAEAKVLGLAVKVARSGAENSVTSADSSENWELDCEICGIMGKNMDDGSEVICCDKCEKWQHLTCHDKADQIRRLPKRDWTKADFICSACSGIPIPRSVKQLRTHVNGKPKRQRPKKVQPVDSNGLPTPSPGVGEKGGNRGSRPKSRITLFVSKPDKLGQTSLNPVDPSQNLASNPTTSVSPQNGSHQTNGMKQVHIAPNLTGVARHHNPIFSQDPTPVTTISPHISPELASAQPSTAPPTPSITGLEPYYDDLDKLIPILRMNVQLHRILPVSVMHRVRRYLIEQQQRRQIVQPPPNPSSSSSSSVTVMNEHPIKPSVPVVIGDLNSNHHNGAVNYTSGPIPAISAALPTAANWYDDRMAKSPTRIESFVDPSFTSSAS